MKTQKRDAPLYVYFQVGNYVLPVPNDKALDTALSKETWLSKFINREETKELLLTSKHKFDQDVSISSNDSIQIYVLAKKEYEYPIFFRGLLDYFVKNKELRYDQHLKDEIPKSIFEELMDYYLIDIKERRLKMVGNMIRGLVDLICIEVERQYKMCEFKIRFNFKPILHYEYFDPNKATLTDFEEKGTRYNIISNLKLYEIVKLMIKKEFDDCVVNWFLNSDDSSYRLEIETKINTDLLKNILNI
ncbi:11745_t:CDS:1 [Gigaspora margarita]|uniref:11745_t:CDS:1 n=1 Tax=Gigaspora margarita TaxID=4874 RepID=A0ABN7UR29_GIGMA|nr:11745_t:CDS:1 [Gigaspora margarita]